MHSIQYSRIIYCHPNNGCIECICVDCLQIVCKLSANCLQIVCKLSANCLQIVRFLVDNSENWRIVYPAERTSQQRSDNVEVLQISDAFSCDADDERDSSH